MEVLKYGTLIAQSRTHMDWVELKNKRLYGASFEEKAAEYLIAQGYRFVARNVTFKSGEIDLIFEVGAGSACLLVFVEVRKRGTASYIRAEETLTYTNERRLRCAMQLYLCRYRGPAKSVRVDLIAFQENEIRHFPNFLP
jgi:putative endonuclease